MNYYYDIDSFLREKHLSRSVGSGRPRILFLADTDHSANVVKDHINEIIEHSHLDLFAFNPIKEPFWKIRRLWSFEGILVHYSIFILSEYFLPPPMMEFISQYRGPVVQIIQDEYRQINAMSAQISKLGIGSIFSSLTSETAEKVYNQSSLHNKKIISTLPGYIPRRLLKRKSPLISERSIHLIYRGRELTPNLGRFSQLKRQIVLLGNELTQQHDIRSDLETKENKRIYGGAWDDFLVSGKAMLGVEGGASVFDFDGAIESAVNNYMKEHPNTDFETIFKLFLQDIDGKIIHRTITPRIFEAIALKTALILIPGDYRGILKPWRHYIPLKSDGSNLPEIEALLRNDEYLQNMVDRTYTDIIENAQYSFERYAAAIHFALYDEIIIFKNKCIISNFNHILNIYNSLRFQTISFAKHLNNCILSFLKTIKRSRPIFKIIFFFSNMRIDNNNKNRHRS